MNNGTLDAGAMPVSASTAAVAPKQFSDAYRTYVLVALAVVGFMCSVDKVVISMFMEPIKKEFLLSDTQLGLMTGLAFALLGGIVSIPLARMADRGNRKRIIFLSFVAWTLMTGLSGMATSFALLLAARIGVGVGEAGCVPASHSMLGDYYPRELRGRAYGAHFCGVYLGMLGGMLGGGILVQTVGWRMGFIILGVLGMVMALVFHFTVREPLRVDQPPPSSLGASIWTQLGDLRCFFMLVFAFAFVGLAGAVAAWLPSYFERAFAMSPMAIGLGLGLCIGLASGIGALIGGQLTVKFGKGSRTWGARYSARVSWGVLLPFIASFYVPNPLVAMALLFLTFLVAGTLAGPVFGTVQDLVTPQARATAVAIIGVVGVVIGQGMGPLIVGMLSDALNTGANVDGLRMSMTLVALINLFTGLFFWLLGKRIARVYPTPGPTV
ncbi:MFS transporter [Massilia sp. ST3]|uniref:MFS transporter n=1 Tax=Massilia sp. ST3 TaxID=2824903 RepID=UPI001B8199AA|nr:MFS transporter [Massilia sp. ST3]MBQ5947922.1 MFS transporter [Massilia sp. ST3]